MNAALVAELHRQLAGVHLKLAAAHTVEAPLPPQYADSPAFRAARETHGEAFSDVLASMRTSETGSAPWRENMVPHKVFATRLGVKVGTVKRWCHEGMPSDRRGVAPRAAVSWIRKHRRHSIAFHRIGEVYFVRDAQGRVKIGFSSNVTRRIRELTNETLGAIDLLGAVPGDMRTERALHRRFASFRVGGEWFRSEPELLTAIAALCDQQTRADRAAVRGVP